MLDWLSRLFLSVDRTSSSVVRLLQSDPSGWEFGEHRATHAATKIMVWIANQDYGLHVELNGQQTKLTKYERRMIWRTVRPIVEANRRRRETLIDRVVSKFLSEKEAA